MSAAQRPKPIAAITCACLLSTISAGCGVLPVVTRPPSHGSVHDVKTGAPVRATEIVVTTSSYRVPSGPCSEDVLGIYRTSTDAEGHFHVPAAHGLRFMLFVPDSGPAYCERYRLSEGGVGTGLGETVEPSSTQAFVSKNGRFRLAVQEGHAGLPAILPIVGVIGGPGSQGIAANLGALWFFARPGPLYGVRMQIEPGPFGGSALLGLQYVFAGRSGGADLSGRVFQRWRKGYEPETRVGPELGINLLMLRFALAAMTRVAGQGSGSPLQAWLSVSWTFVGIY